MGDSLGEYGGGTRRDRMRDARLAERALRERWPIPAALRGPLIDRLARIALDDAASPREATGAAKAIIAASKLNLEAVAATIKAREHEELAGRVAELEQRLDGGGGGHR